MGFGERLQSWIQAFLNSAKASVLMNESPTLELRIKSGLRHRDPLSLFLFIIAMEGLHVALEDAKVVGLLSGVAVGPSNLLLSHLFYVDDVLFFGEWSTINIEYMVMTLNCFYLVSGLKMNLHKSNFVWCGGPVWSSGRDGRVVGCAPGKLPFKYLGLSVAKNMALI